MRTKDRTQGVEGRRAWIYERPPAPSFADLKAGGDRRATWVRHHVSGNLQQASDIAAHFALRLLPTEICSAVGARLGPSVIQKSHPEAAARTLKNIRMLRPDLDEAAVRDLAWRNWENQGRVHAEFSALHRFLPENRVTVVGDEIARRVLGRGPVICLVLHLGNWEIVSAVTHRYGIVPTSIHIPLENPAQDWIARRARIGIGYKILPNSGPGIAMTRPVLKHLKAGGTTGIFADEAFEGRIMAPFFHREPHVGGNLAVAVRMARLTGATILPTYVLRREGCRFDMHYLEPFDLPPSTSPATQLVDDVVRLNALVEPIVRANLDQWYFLDNQF